MKAELVEITLRMEGKDWFDLFYNYTDNVNHDWGSLIVTDYDLEEKKFLNKNEHLFKTKRIYREIVSIIEACLNKSKTMNDYYDNMRNELLNKKYLVMEK
jgi:hypothetical protein